MSQSLSLNRTHTLCKPEDTNLSPLVFDSPHSGRIIPNDMKTICTHEHLNSIADLYIDELFAHVVEQGAHLLNLNVSRCYVDVNRHIDDIDIHLIDGLWSKPTYPKGRARHGYGVIYRLARGEDIYQTKLDASEVEKRLKNAYHPYHTALKSMINDAHELFGQVYHINCHSMPSSRSFVTLPDIVLSDRNGTTCSPRFFNFVKALFLEKGYSVSINHPYKGGEILRRYGHPRDNRHSLQIEINRALYMDEKTLKKKPKDFEVLQSNLRDITQAIIKASRLDTETALAAD